MHNLDRPTELDELTTARNTYNGTPSAEKAWSDFGENGDRTRVRKQLENVQNDLCVYCENSLSNKGHIDHFQPKSSNWRLTFDWDNLVVSCTYNDSCGDKKGKKFENYWINPYVIDPVGMFMFYSDGQIKGTSQNAKNIIVDLGLNCPRLVRKRKEILSLYQKILLDLATEQPEVLEHFLRKQESPFPTAHKQILNKIIGA
jgi:uncharacterized protein (TIGR02646 family)